MSLLGLNLGYTVKENLRLQEFPRALPSGNPSGKGVYLTVHPFSNSSTDTVCHTVLSTVITSITCVLNFVLLFEKM